MPYLFNEYTHFYKKRFYIYMSWYGIRKWRSLTHNSLSFYIEVNVSCLEVFLNDSILNTNSYHVCASKVS